MMHSITCSVIPGISGKTEPERLTSTSRRKTNALIALAAPAIAAPRATQPNVEVVGRFNAGIRLEPIASVPTRGINLTRDRTTCRETLPSTRLNSSHPELKIFPETSRKSSH